MEHERPRESRPGERALLRIGRGPGDADDGAGTPRRRPGRGADRCGRPRVAGGDHDRIDGSRTVRVGHAELHHVRSRVRVGPGRGDGGRVAERPVAVQIPAEGKRVGGIGIARARSVELDGERRRSVRPVRLDHRGRRLGAGHVADAVDAAADVHVVEVAARADLQIDGIRRRRGERESRARVRLSVGTERHGPDAASGVVAEEQRALVAPRIRAGPVERDRRHRRAAGRARLALDDPLGVLVRVVGVGDGAGAAVQVVAQIEPRAFVSRMPADAFEARPAEVLDREVSGRGDAIQLFPIVPPDVADPELGGAGARRHAKGVAEAVRDDRIVGDVAAADQRVVGHGCAGQRVQPQHGAVVADGIGPAQQVLTAQRTTLRGRWRERRADATRGITAGIPRRKAALAVVDEREARAVATAHVERAVAAEADRADRVARVLLAVILDEHLFGSDHDVAGRGQPRDAPGDHAAVARVARRVRARVGSATEAPPPRRGAADRRVERVQHVDVGLRREARMKREAEEPPVPEVVGVGAEIGEGRRGRVREIVEHLDDAALLGDENAAVVRELKGGRFREAGNDGRLLEPARQDDRPRGYRRAGQHEKHADAEMQQSSHGNPGESQEPRRRRRTGRFNACHLASRKANAPPARGDNGGRTRRRPPDDSHPTRVRGASSTVVGRPAVKPLELLTSLRLRRRVRQS